MQHKQSVGSGAQWQQDAATHLPEGFRPETRCARKLADRCRGRYCPSHQVRVLTAQPGSQHAAVRAAKCNNGTAVWHIRAWVYGWLTVGGVRICGQIHHACTNVACGER